MSIGLDAVAAATGLSVVATPGGDVGIGRVVLAGAEPAGGHDGSDVGGPLGPDVLLVSAWRAPRRGSGLPPVEDVVVPLLERRRPSALALTCPDRRVTLPPAALVAAREHGCALLWGSGDVHERDVVAAMTRLLAGTAGNDDRLAAVLRAGTDLAALAASLRAALGRDVRVSGRAGVLVDTAAEATGVPDDAGLDVALSPTSGPPVGRLLVAGPVPSPADVALVEAVGRVLALAVRVHEADAAVQRPDVALLAGILGEDLVAREAAIRQARRERSFARPPHVMVVVEPFDAVVSRSGLARMAAQLDVPARSLDPSIVTVVHDASIALLVAAGLPVDQLLRAFRRLVTVPVSVGTGRAVGDLRSLPGAYRQARRAATIGRRLGSANQVTAYDDLGALRLMFQLPEHERRAYVAEVLGPVAGPGQEAADMRRLLRALRDTHGNLADAARRLFVHRNTVRQRLGRLETSIGPFLDDPDRRLTVFVALDLFRLDGGR